MDIIAIDPGKVTGIAIYNTEDQDGPETYEVPGGIVGFTEWFHDRIWGWGEPDHILIEDWMVRPNTHKLTPEPDAYLIIGGIQMWCINQHMPLTKIGPSEHKSFNGTGKSMKTRRLGWGERSKDNHHEDACSVLLLGLVRIDHAAATRLLKEII